MYVLLCIVDMLLSVLENSITDLSIILPRLDSPFDPPAGAGAAAGRKQPTKSAGYPSNGNRLLI